jgi:hypothetical protein
MSVRFGSYSDALCLYGRKYDMKEPVDALVIEENKKSVIKRVSQNVVKKMKV